MELVPIRCKGNDCKKYDDEVWWEDIKTIVQLNNQAVDNLHKCDIKNGDQVLVKFVVLRQRSQRCIMVWLSFHLFCKLQTTLWRVIANNSVESDSTHTPTKKKAKISEMKPPTGID